MLATWACQRANHRIEWGEPRCIANVIMEDAHAIFVITILCQVRGSLRLLYVCQFKPTNPSQHCRHMVGTPSVLYVQRFNTNTSRCESLRLLRWIDNSYIVQDHATTTAEDILQVLSPEHDASPSLHPGPRIKSFAMLFTMSCSEIANGKVP